MLVHGEAEKMEFLKQKIVKEFGNWGWFSVWLQVCYATPGIDCFMPANGETVTITTQSDIPVKVSDRLLKRALEEYNSKSNVTSQAQCYMWLPQHKWQHPKSV